MKPFYLLLPALFIATSQAAAPIGEMIPNEIRPLASDWMRANSTCTSGASPAVASACKKRDEIGKRISARGWTPEAAARALDDDCNQKSTVAQYAAGTRDGGVPPPTALRMVSQLKGLTLPESYLKQAINFVYFDRDARLISPEQMAMQVRSLCLFGPGDWKPLQ